MLAFAKDITQNQPKTSKESDNDELKQYMEYQRKLNHERLVYHALDYAKIHLQLNIKKLDQDEKQLGEYLQGAFPVSHRFADAETIMLLLRKLGNGHNATNNWYRMNAYYYALVFESMKRFVKIYNQLVLEDPEKAKEYGVAEGVQVDFDDWTYLYFPDLDFHIGRDLGYTHYPYAKRNKTIEDEINEKIKAGGSQEEAFNAVKDKYEMDDTSLKVLMGKPISPEDTELFFTSVENPIYEALSESEDGRWGMMDGESLLDHSYYMGSHLKVWEWRKREEIEAEADEVLRELNKTSPK
ncbi:MAG: hypothetical protein HOL55_12225 [Nitrospina sp.]|nr:hypothetical protein [Nitrospina sp.]